MLRLIFAPIEFLLQLYKLVIVAYCVIGVLRIPANRFTEALRGLVEPFLKPLRNLIGQALPRSWQFLDWSPAVLFLLVCLLEWLL